MPGYAPADTDEVKRLMDERWSHGDAYVYALPWDRARHEELQGGAARLMIDATIGLSIEALRATGARPHEVVALDVGCGIESVLDRPEFVAAMSRFSRTKVIFSDLSETAIESVRSRHQERAATWDCKQRSAALSRKSTSPPSFEAEYIVSPAETLPLPDASVDLAVSVESIEHWIDVEAALDGLHRVIRPEGVLVLTTPNRDSLHARMGRKMGVQVPFCADDHTHEFGYEELDRLLYSRGFEKVDETGASFAPYWALESALGHRVRPITDSDPEVVEWMNSIGRRCPEFAFCQIKSFRRMS